MMIKTTLKHWWLQMKSGHAYVNLITRSNDGNGGYFERVDFIKKSDMPPTALNIRNYGKYWFYLDNVKPATDQSGHPDRMTAGDVCTWADNNYLEKALVDVWTWMNNLDWKKIAIAGGVIVVGIMIYMMIK